MQLHEVESNVAGLDVRQGFEFIYDLLGAYGISNASISRLKSGSYNKTEYENELLWKDKVFYRLVDNGDDLHDVIDEAGHEELITRHRPRFLIVRDDKQLLAVDTRTSDTLDIPLTELSGYSSFFFPWAGIEKTQLESINYADVKAAEKMALLYDEIVTHNRIETTSDIHSLNVFFSRLLFCFFAEDTGVFSDGLFTNGVASLTAEDGSDTARYLDSLFKVLDLEPKNRKGVPGHFASFGYVNGKLFAAPAASPAFSARARRLILECGTLNWSVINPDIFGSMMQAVVHPGQRESLGMHYTSVENIMKVNRPLFLDDLYEAFEGANTKAKLERLLNRISEIKFFDPACGSGNFLVIAYKELRKLEHRILKRVAELDPKAPSNLFQLSQIKLENFYGIEIDDFAHEIAILSLWLAKHQMNIEFRELFGVEISLIPLRDTGNVICGNATRLDWCQVCPKTNGDELYLLGNPPYLGSSLQSVEQKGDFAEFFRTSRYPRNLDYIALWLLKGADYISDGVGELGFVSTNSVIQGEQVALLWPPIIARGVEVSFAYESFRWSNQARGNAGVSCVIIGLSKNPKAARPLYSSGQMMRLVSNINPYLKASARDTLILPRRSSLSGLPEMLFGSKPADGGNLILSPVAAKALIHADPRAEQFVRRYLGASELLNGEERYALWITTATQEAALAVAGIAERVDRVRAFRVASRKAATRDSSEMPYRFGEARHQDREAIAVPLHSSESREYIPMAIVAGNTVVSNACSVIYGAKSWVFALITSRIHNVWIRTVAGRLKSDFRYSATLCYNTFPVPDLSGAAKKTLTEHTFAVLEAREHHANLTLAQMYDPNRMPNDLRDAHGELDEAVDRLYRKRPFGSDDDRLELLFDMYEAGVAGVEFQHELELVAGA
jgi:hypothetical protein